MNRSHAWPLRGLAVLGAAALAVTVLPAAATAQMFCFSDFDCFDGAVCDLNTNTCVGDAGAGDLTVDGFLAPVHAVLVVAGDECEEFCDGFDSGSGDLEPPSRSIRASHNVVPLRFRLYDQSLEEVTDAYLEDSGQPPPALLSIVLWGDGAPADAIDTIEAAGTSNDGTDFRYGDGGWIFNLDTTKAGMEAGSTYVLTVLMPDGTTRHAAIAIR